MLPNKASAILTSFTRREFKEDALSKALLFRGEEQEQLFALARRKRSEYFPCCNFEIRSVIEVSNICQQSCNFCDINTHSRIKRYTLNYEEVLKIAGDIYAKGRKVILLQSGENDSSGYIDFISKCIKTMKRGHSDLVIMLCLGNLGPAQYKQLRDSGADRYILKFETSNPILYSQIKPSDSLKKRVECLNNLIKLGFEAGSGSMIGLPGQTINDIVQDLFFISNFNLTMASCSVFIPSKGSNYEDSPCGDVDLALNFIALTRIMYPKVLIPSTSSLEKAKKGAQFRGLMAGANTLTVHDGTPNKTKPLFPIYSVDRFTPTEAYIKKIVLKAHG